YAPQGTPRRKDANEALQFMVKEGLLGPSWATRSPHTLHRFDLQYRAFGIDDADFLAGGEVWALDAPGGVIQDDTAETVADRLVQHQFLSDVTAGPAIEEGPVARRAVRSDAQPD